MKALALAALLIASPAIAVSVTNNTPGSVDAGMINSPCHGLEECFIERSVSFAEHGLVEDVDLDVLFGFFYNEGTLSLRHGGVTADVFQNYRNGRIRPEGRYNITLDDEATGVPPGICVPGPRCFFDRLGSFRPDSPLSIFDGMDAFGDWTLIVGDWDSGDHTFLQSFTLRVMTAVPELVMTAASVTAVSEPPLLVLAALLALAVSLRRRA